MSDLHHECGVAAVYFLPGQPVPEFLDTPSGEVSRLIPRMLLDIQNRGQLAAGMSVFNPENPQLLQTYKDVGTVSEVFRLSHRGKSESLMREFSGTAAIGHVRYATCGRDDRNYAQPFERPHVRRHKWFSFVFNGQLANFESLAEELLQDDDHYLALRTDTEIILHEISREMSDHPGLGLVEIFSRMAQRFDGAYSLALLNARGELVLVRDPLGIKPLCFAREGGLFAAASESVALLNLGFTPEQIESVLPGEAVTVNAKGVKREMFAESPRRAHCFFEWIYFANVASTLDERSVYLSRTALGEELARLELLEGRIPLGDDSIVVPVPDTSKAAADAMAYRLNIPCREGLIRNRYSGRTFIEGDMGREVKARMKYTPLREVLQGKRVFLVEDSIVRSTTMRVLLHRIREAGAREVHVRVACPPIIAPCFYGIDMSRVDELFAPEFLRGRTLEEAQFEMAASLGADSLRYLPVSSIARAVQMDPSHLCQACITGEYPTDAGQRLYQVALDRVGEGNNGCRTYERTETTPATVRG